MSKPEAEHYDVLIVGAGLSGIGVACRLKTICPSKSFAVLEARSASGGTWDLFRYPGIRSDSDMFTLGYPFKPWGDVKGIADGASILSYIRETAQEYGIDDLIRYNRKVLRADWSRARSKWTVEVDNTETGETESFSCNFLYTNTGYYRYDEGFTPVFEGMEKFGGQIVHPQHWPEDIELAGKQVVVVGSGATAVTLVPALTAEAEHVTMLQRSPSYIFTVPQKDPLAKILGRFLPTSAVYPVIRWKNITLAGALYQLSRRSPKFVKKLVRTTVARQLPRDYPVDTHFKPTYEPWDQRLCLVPDGDLFKAISAGKASVVTDRIKSFTEKGLLLESGDELQADIVVTATGLNLQMMSAIDLSIDGEKVNPADIVTYKGIMLSGVPNLAFSFGYTNASWTLKSDLAARYICKILNFMDDNGYATIIPNRPDPSAETRPFVELASGYVKRSIDTFPRQGTSVPWKLHQNYPLDVLTFRFGDIRKGVEFGRPTKDNDLTGTVTA